MPGNAAPSVAIVDYGLGNLFSVRHACEWVGLRALITSSWKEVMGAEAVILPGVGAFGDAMESLKRLDLIGPLREIASSGKPLIGICLGMQLLMSESHEFGVHQGLDLIGGRVVRLRDQRFGSLRCKVPQVGWNRIWMERPNPVAFNGQTRPEAKVMWAGSLLEGLQDGEFMYFVHSYYTAPQDPRVTISVSRHGNSVFCSSIRSQNVYGFQFHPERSGPSGLLIYKNLASQLRDRYVEMD